jgi:serine/threonine-protein kinase RsbW
LTEAVNNAMAHGNRYDDQKKIIVSYQKKARKIHLFISDEGTGFDPHKIPDPTKEDRIEMEGGRGVFLMKQLSDEVHFHDQGRTVQLMWKI